MYEDEDLRTSFIRHVVTIQRWCLPSDHWCLPSGEVGEDVEGKGIAARTPNYQIIAVLESCTNLRKTSWMDT